MDVGAAEIAGRRCRPEMVADRGVERSGKRFCSADKIRGAFSRAAGVRVESAPGGLTRVRVGWSSAEPPDPAATLAGLGFEGAYSVPATGELRIEGAAGGAVTSGEEVLIEPAGEWPVVVGGWRRYRGRVRARAVGNEALVINELNMEGSHSGLCRCCLAEIQNIFCMGFSQAVLINSKNSGTMISVSSFLS